MDATDVPVATRQSLNRRNGAGGDCVDSDDVVWGGVSGEKLACLERS